MSENSLARRAILYGVVAILLQVIQSEVLTMICLLAVAVRELVPFAIQLVCMDVKHDRY